MLTFFLILIFLRPFISSLAFPYLNFAYSALLLFFIAIWIIFKRVPLNKLKAHGYPLLLFSLAIIASLIFSIDRANSLKELYKYLSGLLLFLIAAGLIYEDKLRVIRAIVMAGLIISLLAIYQSLFGFQHILHYIAKEKISNSFALDYINRGRAFLPFVSPDMLAGYLIMAELLALSRKKYFLLILPFSVALLLSMSLGALISLSAALAIYFFLQDRFKKSNAILILGILVIAGLIFFARSATQKGHLHPVFSTMMRLNYWVDTIKMIKSHPLTGVGIGNFNLMQTRYAHNSYLQLWAETGILGIISFLWLVASLLKTAIKNAGTALNKKIAGSLIAANAAFLIHNLIDFSFFMPEISLIWWIIVGLAA
jgi:putative inorganic carbon (hco3(-)) transporter